LAGGVRQRREAGLSAPSGAGRHCQPSGADADTFGDALEDPSFLAMLAALVNSGYWFFED
jgi:ribosomal protein L16 Arg81 hydroxylase